LKTSSRIPEIRQWQPEFNLFMPANHKSRQNILPVLRFKLTLLTISFAVGCGSLMPVRIIFAEDGIENCKIAPEDMNKRNAGKLFVQMKFKAGKLFVDRKNAKVVLSKLFCSTAKCRKTADGSLTLDDKSIAGIVARLNDSLAVMPYFDELATFSLSDYPKPEVPEPVSEDASDEEKAEYEKALKDYKDELIKRENLADKLRQAIAGLKETQALRAYSDDWKQYFKNDFEDDENDGLYENWRRVVEKSPTVRTAFNDLWKAVGDEEHEFFVLEQDLLFSGAFGPAPDDERIGIFYPARTLFGSFIILTTDLDFGAGTACLGLRDPLAGDQKNTDDPLAFSVEPESEAVFVKHALEEAGLVGSLWSQSEISAAVADFYKERGIDVNVLAEDNERRKIIVERPRLVFVQLPNLKDNPDELYKVLQRVLPRSTFDELARSDKTPDGKKHLRCSAASDSASASCRINLKRKSEPEDAESDPLVAKDDYIFFDDFLLGRISLALKEMDYGLVPQLLSGRQARNGFVEYSWVIFKNESRTEEEPTAPAPTATPVPGATPAPTPSPGASPSVTPNAPDQLFADLHSVFSGVNGKVLARYEKLPDASRVLEVRIENLGLPDRKNLDVVVNENFIGELKVERGTGKMQLRSFRGDRVPQVSPGAIIEIRQKEITLFSGVFGMIPNELKPGPFKETTTKFLYATLYKACPRDNNWFYAGVDFRPRQGTRLFGGYKCLAAGPGALGFKIGGFGEIFGSVNYYAKTPFLKIGAYKYDLALSVNGSTDFERNRVIDGLKTNERRTGGTLRAVLLPLFSPSSRAKAEIMFEANRQTVALQRNQTTVAKQNLTTLETGFRYFYRRDSGLRFTTLEVKPRVKFGLGLSADEKKFTVFGFDGHWRRDLNSFFVADLRGHAGFASRHTPIFEQPSFGGEETVRGFRRDDAVGRTLVSLQPEIWLRFRSFLRPSKPDKLMKILRDDFSLAFFYDVGAIYRTTNAFSGQKAGAGFGLRFDFMKQAVFKLDWAYGFGDGVNRRGRFYFTVELPENPF
jgi:hypothetical protein